MIASSLDLKVRLNRMNFPSTTASKVYFFIFQNTLHTANAVIMKIPWEKELRHVSPDLFCELSGDMAGRPCMTLPVDNNNLHGSFQLVLASVLGPFAGTCHFFFLIPPGFVILKLRSGRSRITFSGTVPSSKMAVQKFFDYYRRISTTSPINMSWSDCPS